jgi:hypothetical protein
MLLSQAIQRSFRYRINYWFLPKNFNHLTEEKYLEALYNFVYLVTKKSNAFGSLMYSG